MNTVSSLRRELATLKQMVSSRSTKQGLQDISAMDLQIVGKLRAIKLQEAKDERLQNHQANG